MLCTPSRTVPGRASRRSRICCSGCSTRLSALMRYGFSQIPYFKYIINCLLIFYSLPHCQYLNNQISMLSNPFTQRSLLSSSLSSSSIHYTSDRRYFPTVTSNTHKPGFLVASQATLPTVYSDIRSPYSTLGYKEEHRVRRSGLGNPFQKSHLLDNSKDEIYTGYGSDNYSYAGLAESQVTPVEPNSYNNYNLYGKKQSRGNEDQGGSYIIKKKSSPTKQQQNRYNQNRSRQQQPLIRQIIHDKVPSSNPYASPSYSTNTGYNSNNNYNPNAGYNPNPNQNTNTNYNPNTNTNPNTNPNYNPNTNPNTNTNPNANTNSYKPLKKTPSYQNPESPYTPLNQEYGHMNRNPSYIDKIKNIQEEEEEDDPLNYNAPSFNMKGKFQNKQSIDSPTFNTKASPIYGQGKERENQGMQANKLRGENYPQTINYRGKTFYLTHVDQL